MELLPAIPNLTMLRRYFIWRASRKMGRTRYRIDRRHYRGPFRSGFHAHLSASKFFQSSDDRFQRGQRRKRRLLFLVAVLGTAGLLWLVAESIRALHLF